LRFWTYAVLAALFAMEVASWIVSRVPPCIVDAAKYGRYYAENNECPAPHVFFVVSLARILEAVGHEWVTAIATAVIAAFTATIFAINRKQLKHSQHVERAYISGGGALEMEEIDLGTETIQDVTGTVTRHKGIQRKPTGNFVLCVNNYGKTA